MKLYISIPISGRPLHEAKYHAECIKAALTPHGHECITPFDVCYYLGSGVKKDVIEASKWYKKAAEQGHAGAKERLRKMFG